MRPGNQLFYRMSTTVKKIDSNPLIVVVYVVLICLLVFIGYRVVRDGMNITQAYDNLVSKSVTKLRLLNKIRQDAQDVQNTTIHEVFHPKQLQPGEDATMGRKISEIDIDLLRYKPLLEDDRERALYKDLVDAWRVENSSADSLRRDKANEDQSFLFYENTERQAFTNFEEAMSPLRVYLFSGISDKDKVVGSPIFRYSVIVSVLLGLVILLLVLLGVLVVKNLRRQYAYQEELKNQEVAMEESRGFYKNLFEQSPLPKYLYDRETLRFQQVNASLIKLYGYSEEEFLKMTILEIVAEEFREIVRAKAASTESFVGKNYVRRNVKKNGEKIWVDVNLNDMFYQGQKSVLVVLNDITEKMRIEQQMRESEELYRSLFDKSPVPVLVSAQDNLEFLAVNDKAVEVYGYTQEEFCKLTVFDIRTEEYQSYLHDLIKNQPTDNVKSALVRHRKKNGEMITIELALDTITYKGRPAYLAIANDITQTMALQQQLLDEKLSRQIDITRATINAQEKERNELGRELHDNVNQLLATVKLYLETAMEMPQHNAEFLAKGKKIVNECINEIRKISKSLVPPSLGDLTLREALNELLTPLKLTKKKVVLNLVGLNELALSNELKISLFRMVQEQVANILKHSEATLISVSLTHKPLQLELQITDNGKGFDPLKKGRGIGLANISNRAAVLNGRVSINSAPGQGCKLSVHFDLAKQPRAESEYEEGRNIEKSDESVGLLEGEEEFGDLEM